MKTTRSTAIAIAIALFATAAMAQTESPRESAPGTDPQSITIAFKKAVQDRSLVYAMRTQLNPNFLRVDKPVYTVTVRTARGIAYISGSLKEWQGFFNIKDDDDARTSGRNRLHLKQALLDQRLVRAMHEQLTPALLREDKPVYTAEVRYDRTIVYIYATKGEWKWFFRIDAKSDPLGS